MILSFCTPNAMLTLAEYLADYAPEQTKINGMKVIEENMNSLNEKTQKEVRERIKKINQGERDLYF